MIISANVFGYSASRQTLTQKPNNKRLKAINYFRKNRYRNAVHHKFNIHYGGVLRFKKHMVELLVKLANG